MRRVSAKWWVRLTNGWGFGLTFTLSALGVWSGVRGAVAAYNTVPPWVSILVPVACVVVGLVVALIRGYSKMLPDSFVDEFGSDGPYRSIPATSETLREACEMTRPHYGREFVGHELAEQWRLANPHAFECVYNRKGELCASFGVLPLSDAFMEMFIDGRIDDLHLLGKDIRSVETVRKCKRLYISGVVVRDAGKMAGSRRARVMLWAMLQHFKREYGLRTPRELYAIAVTKDSARLMEGLKFERVSDGKHRVDKYPLYRYALTKASWDKLLCEIGECSGMCCIGETLQ